MFNRRTDHALVVKLHAQPNEILGFAQRNFDFLRFVQRFKVLGVIGEWCLVRAGHAQKIDERAPHEYPTPRMVAVV